MSAWFWHLFNDPMRDNPWSLLALALLLCGTVLAWWRSR